MSSIHLAPDAVRRQSEPRCSFCDRTAAFVCDLCGKPLCVDCRECGRGEFQGIDLCPGPCELKEEEPHA
jgi:predicted amidophosphoribosyltransferase